MPNDNRQVSFKSPKKLKNHVSNYNKRQMLTMLKQSNCHPKELQAMISRFKVDENLIKQFINEQADAAQNRIEQKFIPQLNKHFTNLDECAKNLASQSECATDNTLPVTLEALAHLEKHPPSSQLNGINLKVLYETLANMTAGYPVNDIDDEPTKEFLKQCYTELNDSVMEMDAKSLKNLLDENDKQTQPVYSWLCNSDYNQYLMKLFQDISSDNDNDNVMIDE